VIAVLPTALLALLLAYPVLLVLGVSLPHLLLNRRFFGRTSGRRAAFDGLTTVVPLRGTSPSLAARLASHLRHPPPVPFRLVLCLESEDDPAHAAAVELRRAHPEADVVVRLSGPPGAGLGKTHNLAAGLAEARHEAVAFVDADVEVGPEDYAAALDRLSDVDAAFLPPYHDRPATIGSACVAWLLNHVCFPGLAAMDRAGRLDFFVGPFMVFRRSALEAIGGLEPLRPFASDDLALSLALRRAGRTTALVPRVRVQRPDPSGLGAARDRFARWLRVVRWMTPRRYALFLAGATGTSAAAGVVLGALLGGRAAAAAAIAGGLYAVLRLAVAAAQDRLVLGRGAPAWTYALLLGLDLLQGPLALIFLFGRRVRWAGREYLLGPEGRIVEVRPVPR